MKFFSPIIVALPLPLTALRTSLLMAAGVALMILSARVQIPFWPVPMTLHTLVVFAYAVLFGPRWAISIFTAYLAAGALGFPVFSGTPERGIGLAYMVGPTGGYLLGFLFASGVVGALAAGRNWLGQAGAMLIGLILVYGFGLAWLAFFIPGNQLLALGVAPFLLGDLLKMGLVLTGSIACIRLMRRFGDRQP